MKKQEWQRLLLSIDCVLPVQIRLGQQLTYFYSLAHTIPYCCQIQMQQTFLVPYHKYQTYTLKGNRICLNLKQSQNKVDLLFYLMEVYLENARKNLAMDEEVFQSFKNIIGSQNFGVKFEN
jgi:hypothetical protein